jgi:hypothetical protein
MNFKSFAVAFIHAFIGWFLCAATMGIGSSLTSMQNTLYIHATLAPIFFFAISAFYAKRYGHYSPITTAIYFTSIVVLIDFFVVALIILNSLEMFSSILGTWIPFGLIFVSTYLGGVIFKSKNGNAA